MGQGILCIWGCASSGEGEETRGSVQTSVPSQTIRRFEGASFFAGVPVCSWLPLELETSSSLSSSSHGSHFSFQKEPVFLKSPSRGKKKLRKLKTHLYGLGSAVRNKYRSCGGPTLAVFPVPTFHDVTTFNSSTKGYKAHFCRLRALHRRAWVHHYKQNWKPVRRMSSLGFCLCFSMFTTFFPASEKHFSQIYSSDLSNPAGVYGLSDSFRRQYVPQGFIHAAGCDLKLCFFLSSVTGWTWKENDLNLPDYFSLESCFQCKMQKEWTDEPVT